MHTQSRAISGFLLIETIVAMAIFIIIATAGAGFVLPSLRMNRLSGTLTDGMFFATEGLEAARSIKNQGWATPFLATNCLGGCGISTASGYWAWNGSNNAKPPYTRVVTVSDVYRDGTGTVVTSGGTLDANTKKVTSVVNWLFTPLRTETVTLVTYLTNWGKKTFGNWSSPSLGASFDLTNANSGNNTANGISIAYANNFVYLGRVNSSGREFYIFDVSNPDVPTLVGQRALNGDPNDIAINGSYAYIASSDNSSELQIIDVSDPATIGNPGKLTTVDLTNGNSGSNNADAVALVVSGTNLFMVRNGGDDFLIFDITSPAAPGSPIGRMSTFVGNPTGLVVIGNYSFVTSNSNTDELQVINVTNKALPVNVVSLNLNSGNENADALSVSGSGNYIFVGRVASAAPEVYAIDITTPTVPSVVSAIETGANVVSLDYDSLSGYVFSATSDTALDLKIVDASVPTALVMLSQLNINNSPLQLVYDSTLDRVFIASSDDTQEFEVIKPL